MVGMKSCQDSSLQCSKWNPKIMTVNDTLDVFAIRQDLLSYIPTLVPPHHLSPPSMTPPRETHHLLGQRKQTYVVYCFFWQGRKANSLRAWRSYRSSPPLPYFLFFIFLILRIFAGGLPVHVSLRQQSCCATEQYPVFFFLAGAWEEGKVGSFQMLLCQFDRSARR